MAAAARRKENAPRGLSYGMWRAPWLAALIALLAQPAVASIFAEGGRLNGGDASGYQSLSNDEQQQYEEQLRELYDQRMAEEEAALAEQANYEQQLAEIISQYQAGQLAGDDVSEADKLEVSNQYGPQRVEDDVDVELQPAPEALKQKQEEIKAEKTNKELVEKTNDDTEKPVVAQKKGQSEFVSFVEPVPAAQTRDIPSLEKRRLAQAINGNAYSRGAESNLMMMAVGCLLVIGVIGGAIGSIVYRRRKDSPDDSEYAPYAGTGPFKRAKKGDKGDETLAYKAQLHHYQQAKQKIICGDDAPGVGLESDEEECADDENNFSVYECPGLAPTGDIEVHNPNFGQ